MTKQKWLWNLRRLAKQKKDENDAIKKANNISTSSAQPKGMKYLGKL